MAERPGLGTVDGAKYVLALESERDRLREALEEWPQDGSVHEPCCPGVDSPDDCDCFTSIARAALAESGPHEAAAELGWDEASQEEYDAFLAGWWACWKRQKTATGPVAVGESERPSDGSLFGSPPDAGPDAEEGE